MSKYRKAVLLNWSQSGRDMGEILVSKKLEQLLRDGKTFIVLDGFQENDKGKIETVFCWTQTKEQGDD